MASTFEQMQKAGRRIVPFTGLDEFGLTISCCSISEKESADHEATSWKPGTTQIDPQRLLRSRRLLLSLTVCDENGKRLLTEDQASQLDSKLADILHDQAREHTKAPKVKNSPAASDDEKPSASRPTSDAPTSIDSSTSSTPSNTPSGENSLT